jgi:predicted signal transduction protein with EAL and GGDEF domain
MLPNGPSRRRSASVSLGLSVIAEGIENRASADLLLTMGCEEGQGYFFGKPMPAADFEAKYDLLNEPRLVHRVPNRQLLVVTS